MGTEFWQEHIFFFIPWSYKEQKHKREHIDSLRALNNCQKHPASMFLHFRDDLMDRFDSSHLYTNDVGII